MNSGCGRESMTGWAAVRRDGRSRLMRTALTEMFNVEAPIFAFSHCRDVVVEVSKAGGVGVLGATRFTPRQLETELSWIDDHIGGRPYGVDVLIPQKFRTSTSPNQSGSSR